MSLEVGPELQALTDEDRQLFDAPKRVILRPPPPSTPEARRKLDDWIEWRAAPYPAERRGEYLWIPERDDGASDAPRILVSAVLETPASVEDYLERVPGKQRYTVLGRKAKARGYRTEGIDPRSYASDIWEIVHSMSERQGRPLAAEYRDRPRDFDFPSYRSTGDPNYEDICCGVFSDGTLVAYLLGKRVGEHVQYDEIMGHRDHLSSDVMYLLHIAFVERCIERDVTPGVLNYGPWYSGADAFSSSGGLNRWKRRVGFLPAYLILASS